MKNLAIIGATGLVGKHFTQLAINSKEFNNIHAWVRKHPQHPISGVTYHVFNFDKDDYPFKDLEITHAFSGLGTTLKTAGSKEKQWKIDHDYNLNFFQAFKTQEGQAAALISAMGANSKSLFFYNQMKGKLDEALTQLNLPKTIIVKPSLIIGDRTEKRTGERLFQQLFKAIDFLIPKKMKGNKAEKIAAKTLSALLQKENGLHILTAEQLH